MAARASLVAGEELLSELQRRGYASAEVYTKRGRSRSFERTLDRETTIVAVEEGWAARAGDARRSIFVAATGAPTPAVALPDASPHALLLPEGDSDVGERWTDPVELDAPLATENEASALVDGIARGLAGEASGARLVSVSLVDGFSESALVSSRSIRTRMRSRSAWLRLEAEAGGRRLLLSLAERESRRFRPDAIARRLADRFAALGALADRGAAKLDESPSHLVLAAPLVARLVEAVAPLFVGRIAGTLLSPLLDAERRLGAAGLTLVDDGRFGAAASGRSATGSEGAGLLAAAADGEGVRTGERRLVEAGQFAQGLVAWWEVEGPAARERSSGCSRRASWRDLPRRGPTHFYLAPGETQVREIVEEVDDGAYLIDAEGGVALDLGRLEFSVAVSGYRLTAGRAVAPLGACRLHGAVAELFHGIRAVARDLTFVPGNGQFGAPTILVTGLRLAPESEAPEPAPAGSSSAASAPVVSPR